MTNDLVDELLGGVEWLRHYPQDSGGHNYPSDAPLRAAAALKAADERVHYAEGTAAANISRANEAEAALKAAEAEINSYRKVSQAAGRALQENLQRIAKLERDIAAARSRIAELEQGLTKIAEGDWSWGVEHDKKVIGQWARLARAALRTEPTDGK